MVGVCARASAYHCHVVSWGRLNFLRPQLAPSRVFAIGRILPRVLSLQSLQLCRVRGLGTSKVSRLRVMLQRTQFRRLLSAMLHESCHHCTWF